MSYVILSVFKLVRIINLFICEVENNMYKLELWYVLNIN